MRNLAYCLLFFLAACNLSISQDEFSIDNFKAGLICPDPSWESVNDKNYSPHICFENDTILITGQGTCVFNNESLPCTWYGFEFDYKNAEAGQELNCTSKSDTVGTYGDPDKVGEEDSKSHQFKLKLNHTKTHFVNPGYSIYVKKTEGKNIVKYKTKCYAGSKKVLQFSKQLIFPEEKQER